MKPPTPQHIAALQRAIVEGRTSDEEPLREILANVESQVRGDSILVQRREVEVMARGLELEGRPQIGAVLRSWLSSSSPSTEPEITVDGPIYTEKLEAIRKHGRVNLPRRPSTEKPG